MRGFFTSIQEDGVLISISKELYEKSAVFAAAHKFTDRFGVKIEPLDEVHVGVQLLRKSNLDPDITLEQAALDFRNFLVDEQLRLDLESRYGFIRALIVKQAFSPIGIDQFTEQTHRLFREKNGVTDGK